MTEVFRELLLGCGRARDKRIFPLHKPGTAEAFGYRDWQNLVTLDRSDMHKPDVVCNLEGSTWFDYPGPAARFSTEYIFGGVSDQACDVTEAMDTQWQRFKDNSFDEVHAYEVLEHLGFQGDACLFFRDFSELWRILKPDGYLCATVPSRFSPWLWGDPSHRRAILPESLTFLDQSSYKQCEGPKPSPLSDFRDLYKADFQICERTDNNHNFMFILQAVKPSRWKEPT